MDNEGKISLYRDRLDRTLSSPELTNAETLKSLIKEQLRQSSTSNVKECSQALLEKRTLEVSNFLDMLRSASLDENEARKACEIPQPAWKLKQDTEELRVMYREGPNGSPFHSLLVEGYINGPLDVCMCVNWESALYKKWWPQSTVPTFKIISCKCLQKIRIGEQISLVRMKLSWPISSREAVVHYFEFEYLQDDLIVVLLTTIPDMDSINENSHGFTKDGIPEAKDVVRIDLIGGYALQKVSPTRSYFRTIVNMDIKLDFVPPSLINFISRQLIGNGFKLYQKVVSSVINSDDDFSKALTDPLYRRIHSAVSSVGRHSTDLKGEEPIMKPNSEACTPSKEHIPESVQNDLLDINGVVQGDDHASDSLLGCSQLKNGKEFAEIEEEASEEWTSMKQPDKDHSVYQGNCVAHKCPIINGKSVNISFEVQQALGTLEKAIYIVREHGFNNLPVISSGLAKEKQDININPVKVPASSNGSVTHLIEESSKKEGMERAVEQLITSSGSHSIRHTGSNNKIAPALPGQNHLTFSEIVNINTSSFRKGKTETALEYTTQNMVQVQNEAIERNEKCLEQVEVPVKNNKTRKWLCGFPTILRR